VTKERREEGKGHRQETTQRAASDPAADAVDWLSVHRYMSRLLIPADTQTTTAYTHTHTHTHTYRQRGRQTDRETDGRAIDKEVPVLNIASARVTDSATLCKAPYNATPRSVGFTDAGSCSTQLWGPQWRLQDFMVGRMPSLPSFFPFPFSLPFSPPLPISSPFLENSILPLGVTSPSLPWIRHWGPWCLLSPPSLSSVYRRGSANVTL